VVASAVGIFLATRPPATISVNKDFKEGR
jgi:hypothetical protein